VRIQNLTKHVLRPQQDGTIDVKSLTAYEKNKSINSIREVTQMAGPYGQNISKNNSLLNGSLIQSSAMHDQLTRNTANAGTQ